MKTKLIFYFMRICATSGIHFILRHNFMKPTSRRTFMKAGALGISGAVAVPFISHAATLPNPADAPKDLTILFQGDSITDAGRDRSRYYPNETAGMGQGYVFQIVAHLLGTYPEKDWKYYNRGISGNKVFQLADRWQDDCLQLKPDVLSILIGVNDFWHSLRDYPGTVKTYNEDFRRLLDRTLAEYPNIKLMIGEPFALKGGTAINERWYPYFPEYQTAAKDIAKDYNAVFIPYQKILDDALKLAPVSYWSPDGVHPSMAGAFKMKEAWLQAFSGMY
jgi:lysophospholipase L1-like esterase